MRRGKAAAMALALAVGAGLALQAPASATHPHPRGATPIRIPLVPIFKKCTAPNSTHGAPLAFQSCNPPVPFSPYTTIGTPDANGAAANSVGFARIDTIVGAPGPPDDSDIRFSFSVNDVRCGTATSASVCTSPNTAGGADYSGQLALEQADIGLGPRGVRLTDHDGMSGSTTNLPVTVTDIPLDSNDIAATCQNTADPAIGSQCSATTTMNAVLPGYVKDGKRLVMEMGNLSIYDGGPDGNPHTDLGEAPAMTQGLFVP